MNQRRIKSAEKIRLIAFIVVGAFILASFLVYLINTSGINLEVVKTVVFNCLRGN